MRQLHPVKVRVANGDSDSHEARRMQSQGDEFWNQPLSLVRGRRRSCCVTSKKQALSIADVVVSWPRISNWCTILTSVPGLSRSPSTEAVRACGGEICRACRDWPRKDNAPHPPLLGCRTQILTRSAQKILLEVTPLRPVSSCPTRAPASAADRLAWHPLLRDHARACIMMHTFTRRQI